MSLDIAQKLCGQIQGPRTAELSEADKGCGEEMVKARRDGGWVCPRCDFALKKSR